MMILQRLKWNSLVLGEEYFLYSLTRVRFIIRHTLHAALS